MPGTTQGGHQAATTTTPAAADADAAAATAAAAAAAAAAQPDLAAARAAGIEHGIQAERERTAAILTHAQAQGRSALAIQCVTSGLSVEQAGAILASAPQASVPSASANAFAQHMAALGNPATSGTDAPEHDHNGPGALAASWDAAFGIQPGRA